MNNLVKLLVEDLLNGDSRIVAIFGGGFKPPTAGHLEVVKKALTQFPEINDFIVYVGGGVRDGITQKESLNIWDIYKKHLPNNVKIETAVAPVKAILDYAKNNPNDTVYWILGSREGNEGDIKDLIDRTKSIGKYPNIEVKNIITNDSISGTKAREALKANNKEEFLQYIPNIPEQEQIWNIVSPVIKEEVTDTEVICDKCGWHWSIADGGDDLYICHKCEHDNNPALGEGRKKKPDPKVGTGKKPEGSGRRLYTDEDPKDTVHVKFKTKEDIVDTLNKESFKAKSHARQSQIINLIHQRVRAAYNKAKDPEVKSRLKRALDYIESRKEASKEKTERLRKMKEASDPQAGTALPYGSGFAPVKESYQFKASDEVYDDKDNSLITAEYKFSTPDNNYRVEFYSGEYSPEEKTFDVSFGIDKGDNSKLDTFQMTGEGNALSILKTVVDIIIDFTNSFEVNKLVINPTSEKREKIYSMILKSLPSDISNKVELIKENNEKTWDLKEGIVSLTKYMVDNGLNIKPLPKVKFISNDKENASNLLGRTAYYNPADKSITLYTMDRHPKDILRSFSHEMVHHMQNLEGRLNNINTTNTNEDGDLPKIEEEAYKLGNMMLRNWEDSKKNV